jgi:hypothetical protein
MFRRLLAWLGGRFGNQKEGGENGDEGSDGDGDDSRFVPSLLDSSVRYAHGGSNAAGEQEIVEVKREARRLEEQQRDN